ncbi:MAG: hypothetical protein Hyperionvirus2_215 [Hyperionvirus sp.]|uniref:Uncharacterized protein n=1 Tax=Hyperionvirus sp. TaxID=2487770 RepID=A0A3G5A6H4_9VIRU|nr:MAG: hypothetical protein Hyperionvirus2_215 [Hyperionvirus sp.]
MAVAYSSEFTKLGTAPLVSGGSCIKKRCFCCFCSNEHDARFPVCSKECLGMDESNLEPTTAGYYVLKRAGLCMQLHSKCLVPDCDGPRERYMMDQKMRGFYGWSGGDHHQPFCVKHLPKCACGNCRYTKSPAEMKYPLSKEDAALFAPKCAKCTFICAIPECKQFRCYIGDVAKDDKMTIFCYDHGKQFGIDPARYTQPIGKIS